MIPYATSWNKPLWNIKSRNVHTLPDQVELYESIYFLITGYLQKLDARNELLQLFSLSTENDPLVLVWKAAVKPVKGQLSFQDYHLNHKYF